MQKQKSHVVTLLLSFFLGGLGLHRFYTGYIGLGVLQILTGGGCGIWTIIDFISICFNKYQDADGQDLKDYNKVLGLTFFYVWVLLFVLCILLWAAGIAQMKGLH